MEEWLKPICTSPSCRNAMMFKTCGAEGFASMANPAK